MAEGANEDQPSKNTAATESEPRSPSSTAEVSSSKKRKAPSTKSPSEEADERPAKDKKQEDHVDTKSEEPPLPDEATPPPLPDEDPPPVQTQEDDGWEPVWDDTHHTFYFYNRFTQVTQWENPRVPSADQTQPTNHERIAAATTTSRAPGTAHATPGAADTTELHPAVAGGYNPAIHGSYDPNAPYAQYATSDPVAEAAALAAAEEAANANGENYAGAAHFNRFTGRFQSATLQPSNFNDESKAKRQMSAFFDVDAAANSHDGRSLKAERAGRKLTKEEVKQFRSRNKERKEEKKRAWLRD